MVTTRLIALLMGMLVPACALAGPNTRQLVEVVDISGVSISPDGKTVVFREERSSIERNRTEMAWHVVATDGSNGETRIADGGDAILNDSGVVQYELPEWSADSRSVYYRALFNHEVQIWGATRDGGNVRQITFDPADIDVFALLPDGESLVYRVGASREQILKAEREEYDRGIRFDKTIEVGQAVFRGGVINGRLATQRLSGDWFARAGLLHGTPPHFKVVNLQTRNVREASPSERALLEARARRPVFNTNGSTVVVEDSTSRRSAKLHSFNHRSEITVLDSGGNVLATCPNPSCPSGNISWIAWRPGTSEIILARSDASRSQTVSLWNFARQTMTILQSSDGLISGNRRPDSSCAANAALAVCVMASAAKPPRLASINLGTSAQTILASPNSGLPQAHVQTIEWRDAKGRLFTGQFYPARGDNIVSAPPLFLTYYTCSGYLRGGLGDEWPLAIFADKGIAALCINARTATDFGQPQNAVADYDIGLGAVHGAIDYLRGRGLIDKQRVGMGGLSFGSEVAMWVATHSDLLSAVSISSALIEPAYYWFNGGAGRDNHALLMQGWGLGSPDATPDRWRQVSMALNVEHIHIPVLMQLPEQEFRYNLELISRLEEAGLPTEVYIFPDEAHIKAQPRHKLAVYNRNIDWFSRWLLEQSAEPSTPPSHIGQ